MAVKVLRRLMPIPLLNAAAPTVRLTNPVTRAFSLALALFTAGASQIGMLAQAELVTEGFVVEMRGQWELRRAGTSNPLPVAVRTGVFAGDEIRKNTEQADAFVIVASYSGRLTRQASTFVVQPTKAPPGRIELLIRTIQTRCRETFITAAVRGGTQPNDAVVREEAAGVDLTPVFADARPGTYLVTFHDVSAEGAVTRLPRTTADVTVSPESARGPALGAGLYQLEVNEPAADFVGSAWIRVLSGRAYETAAADFAGLRDAAERDDELVLVGNAIARTYLALADGRFLR